MGWQNFELVEPKYIITAEIVLPLEGLGLGLCGTIHDGMHHHM